MDIGRETGRFFLHSSRMLSWFSVVEFPLAGTGKNFYGGCWQHGPWLRFFRPPGVDVSGNLVGVARFPAHFCQLHH